MVTQNPRWQARIDKQGMVRYAFGMRIKLLVLPGAALLARGCASKETGLQKKSTKPTALPGQKHLNTGPQITRIFTD
ncbi:MAG: hypothetical protein LBD55_01735 [Treponema sp.]|jgi:hypothetical protein|nr:hypothetical protein [Treponema sp.]